MKFILIVFITMVGSTLNAEEKQTAVKTCGKNEGGWELPCLAQAGWVTHERTGDKTAKQGTVYGINGETMMMGFITNNDVLEVNLEELYVPEGCVYGVCVGDVGVADNAKITVVGVNFLGRGTVIISYDKNPSLFYFKYTRNIQVSRR